MKLYISSQMSGLPDFNYPAFFEVEKQLIKQGHEIINPARIGEDLREIIPNPSRRDYLTSDIMELMECQGIVFFGNWYFSAGCRLELHLVMEFDMKLFFWNKEKGQLEDL
jgi:hypothetical protein